ncbi:MAG TPA: ABC transporter permease [Ignavibacteria bacterium]|nr:ABC transporter permease [Ignavibacteria bacterium]
MAKDKTNITEERLDKLSSDDNILGGKLAITASTEGITGEKDYKDRPDQTYWSLVKKQYKKNRLAIIALYFVIFFVVIALVADLLANNKPVICTYKGTFYAPVFKQYMVDLGISKWDTELLNVDWKSLEYDFAIWPPVRYYFSDVDLFNNMAAPSVSSGHFLGTDGIGRDVLSGLIHGSRISLSVGFIAAGISLFIGVILGSIAGFYGGRVDIIIMRFVEIMQLFPAFFLIITIVALYGSSIWYVMLAIGLTSWTINAKFTRGEVLKVRNMDYVSAATSLGLSNTRIIFRHVLPNALAPVLVAGAFEIAGAILTEAGLSFLGFGVKATTVTWGSLLNEARGATTAWWLAIFPGFMIFITIVAYNLVGEGLRDALDPRLRD